VSRTTFGSLPWRTRSQRDLVPKSCPANNFVIWSWISKIFHRNDHHIETTCRAQHLGRYLEGQGHNMTLLQSRVQPITLLFKVGFRKYFTKMTTLLRRRVAHNIWVPTLKVKVTARLVAKSCPANNFVIWSWISKIFHRNDHHIETTCRAQHLGRYLECQGHNMTLLQSRVQPITLLFEVGFRKYFTKLNTILRWRVARNIWVATLKVKVTA